MFLDKFKSYSDKFKGDYSEFYKDFSELLSSKLNETLFDIPVKEKLLYISSLFISQRLDMFSDIKGVSMLSYEKYF